MRGRCTGQLPGLRAAVISPRDPWNSQIAGCRLGDLDIRVELSNRGQHLAEPDRAFVTKPIDIEGWCAIYPAREPPRTIVLDALGVHTIRELSRHPICIEPQASGVPHKTGIIERVLV